MDLFKWTWRGVLVILVLFFGTALYLLSFEGLGILQTQINKLIFKSPVSLRLEMADEVSGLVDANFDIDLEVLSEMLSSSFSYENYPMELTLCLQGFQGFYKQEIDCESLVLSGPVEVSGVAFLKNSHYLPNNQREFDYETVLRITPTASEPLEFVGRTVKFSWSPKVAVLGLDAVRFDSARTVFNRDIVMISSRWKELEIRWNGSLAKTQQITDPESITDFISSEDQSPPSYNWLLSIPQDISAGRPGELCLDLAPDFEECFGFSRGEDPLGDLDVVVEEDLKEAAPEQALVEELEEVADDLVQVGEFIEVSDKLSVLLPARRFTNGNLTINGFLSGTFTKSCLVNLNDGQIFNGKFIPANEDGSFYDVLISEELLSDRYAVLMYVDRGEPCEQLLDEWIYLDQRSPAPIIIEIVDEALDIDVLAISWFGTEKTEVDPFGRQAMDLSVGGGDFETRVRVKTFFDDEVKVFVLVDDTTTFTHTIPPFGEEDILIKVSEFDIGVHDLLIYAVLPDGTKTADVVMPFDYISAHFTAKALSRFQLWQIFGISVLGILGIMYIWLRFGRILFRIIYGAETKAKDEETPYMDE